jgi:hypothetical protein
MVPFRRHHARTGGGRHLEIMTISSAERTTRCRHRPAHGLVLERVAYRRTLLK